MKIEDIEELRYHSRKLVRELGVLQPDPEDSAMTSAHWHALVEIEKSPGLTISQLGELLLMSPSRVSRLTTMLGKKGFVRFCEGVDRREKTLFLSEEGQESVQHIHKFSEKKIRDAFRFLAEDEMLHITRAMAIYASALEKSRTLGSDVKIATLPLSRTLRKQLMEMIFDIQTHEFKLPVRRENNQCLLKAESFYVYGGACNFWYAVSREGKVVGSVGLRKLNQYTGEVKKFFVIKEYRGTGVAKRLMQTLIKAAHKHGFKTLYLGSVEALKAAHNFYEKYGFEKIAPGDLPEDFSVFELDTVFYKAVLDKID